MICASLIPPSSAVWAAARCQPAVGLSPGCLQENTNTSLERHCRILPPRSDLEHSGLDPFHTQPLRLLWSPCWQARWKKPNKIKKERYPQAETQPGVCLQAVHKQPQTCCYGFRDWNQFQVIKGVQIYPGGAVGAAELSLSLCYSHISCAGWGEGQPK